MRFWYILFLCPTLFSIGLLERLKTQSSKLSTDSQKDQEPESPQLEMMQLYLKIYVAQQEILRKQRPEPKKNDLLKVLEIKLSVSRILQDLEK